MGNINNTWYLKGSGGDWASAKCALDDCYSIPFDPVQDDSLYLQADLPEGYTAQEVWLSAPDGTQHQELLSMTEWKIISGNGWTRLIFKVPQNSYACKGIPADKEVCVMSLYGTSPLYAPYVNEWLSNPGNVQIFIILHVNTTPTYYNISLGQLPPGWAFISPTELMVDCNQVPDLLNTNIVFINSSLGLGNCTGIWPGEIRPRLITEYQAFQCFQFQVPLKDEHGQVAATLVSEPFHCPECTPTLKISSDYCLAKTDIFDDFVFDPSGLGTAQYGPLTSARNDFRIQAVLKKLPSKLAQNTNARCNNFRSTLQQRYRLQGAMPIDFPDYMVRMVESIFSGKKIFIDGNEYIPDGEHLFTERTVKGRSMKKLDIELLKCEKGIVYDCNCTPQTCEDNPLLYTGGMLLTAAPNMGYGVDRSIWYAEIFPSFISGGAPPYTIDNWTWQIGGQTITPGCTFQSFDPQSPVNFFTRGPGYASCPDQTLGPWDPVTNPGGCLSITCKIYDSRGCYVTAGVSVDVDDLRCVAQNGHFQFISKTANSITIGDIQPYGYDFDFSYDGINYFPSGQQSGPGTFTINGLWAANFSVMVRLKCNCINTQNGIVCEYGYIGPIKVTLP